MKLLVDIAKTSKQYKGEITDDQVHYLGSLIHDFDVAGIETEKYSEIEKLFRSAADTERADMSMIQPAYAQAKNLDEEADLDEAYIDSAKDASDLLGELRGIGKSFERGQAEMPRGFANRYASDVWDVYTWIESKTNGFSGIDKDFKSAIDDMMKLRGIAKKKEIAGSDDSGMKDGAFGNQVVTVLYPVMQYMDAHSFDKKEDDESMEEDEQKTPLGEFILSYFDRENGAFPKGETAILTMVEKDYGEQFIEPAKQFIKQVTEKFEEMQMRTQPQQMEAPDTGEHDRIRELAGLR